jgi:hypothetical protein
MKGCTFADGALYVDFAGVFLDDSVRNRKA